MSFQDVVICAPYRTPIGAFGGVFKSITAADLGTQLLRGLLARTTLKTDAVDDVVFANCYPSMDAPAIGRVIALNAGLDVFSGGIQIDRRCGSGLQAVLYGAMQVATGGSDLVIAGGVEVMSRAPFYSHDGRWGSPGPSGFTYRDSLTQGRITAGGDRYPVPGGMLETAENLRRDYHIAREDQDALALSSQARAAAATESGRFAEEIIPIEILTRRGRIIVTRDEHPRPDTTAEVLAALKPILRDIFPDATVTAGNASGQNDGAAACIVTTTSRAKAEGLKPFLRIRSWALSGVKPSHMGIAPVAASRLALDRAGLALDDIDLIELNEAFAAQVLACSQALGLKDSDFDRLNVNGSGIALGHPVGATGVRILTTLAHEMARRESQFGLESMCIGGGQGLAAVFEKA